MFEELRDRLVDKGIAGVKECHYAANEERGAIRGFEMVKSCNDVNELRELVASCIDSDREAYLKLYGEQITTEEYWEKRWCSIQVEHCWEMFKVGLGIYPHSASAGLRYGEIVGIG